MIKGWGRVRNKEYDNSLYCVKNSKRFLTRKNERVNCAIAGLFTIFIKITLFVFIIDRIVYKVIFY